MSNPSGVTSLGIAEQEGEGPVISIPALQEHYGPPGPPRNHMCEASLCLPLCPVLCWFTRGDCLQRGSPESSLSHCCWLNGEVGPLWQVPQLLAQVGSWGYRKQELGKRCSWNCDSSLRLLSLRDSSSTCGLISQLPGHRQRGGVVLRETVGAKGG